MNALECLNAPFCARLALSLAHFLWEGAVIALAAWGVAAALRRHSSRARYGVYCLALGAMVCALAGTILLVEPPKWPRPAAPQVSQRESGPAVFTERPNRERDVPPGRFAGQRNVLPGENTGVSPQGTGGAMKPRWESLSAPLTRWWGVVWPVCAPCVSGVYLAGVLAMMLRLVAALGGSGRLRRLSRPVDDASILQSLARQAQALGLNFTPPIAFCRRTVVPTVVGILRPTVLLPFTFATGLSANQIEMLLAHELAHIRRWDPLVNVAQRLIEALLFFHPAMWFISRRIRVERELCCDDLVVALGGKPLEYASSLVETASRVRPSARPAFLPAEGLNAAASVSQLKSRVKRLLGAPEHEALRISRAWVVLCCIAAVALLAGVLSSGRTPVGKTESALLRPERAASRLQFRWEADDPEKTGAERFELAQRNGKKEEVYLEKQILLNESDVLSASAEREPSVIAKSRNDGTRRCYVFLQFNPEASKHFAEITGANINRRLAVVFDGKAICAPVIKSMIPNGKAVIEGEMSKEEAESICGAVGAPNAGKVAGSAAPTSQTLGTASSGKSAPADLVTTDTLKAALEGIRARKALLESKPLRIEYKRTFHGKDLKEPLTYDCVFLGHNGNYRETETDTNGKVTERYLHRGLRMTIQRRAPGQLSQNAPQGDNSTPDSVEYHPYPFMHWADLTIAREISGQGESQLEHLETFLGKSLPNSRFEEAGGIRCLRFAKPFEPNVAYSFAPDLGWTLVGVGSGNDTASFKARDFKRVQDFYFPMRMDWLGETTEIRKVQVLDDPAKVDADVAPSVTFAEGTNIAVHVSVWRPEYTTKEGCRTTSRGARPFTWKKDFLPREKSWLTVAASEFYFPAFQKAMDRAFPLPFYDDKRDLIVWAKYDRDLEHYLVVHEGDTLPEKFGKIPWAVSLDPRVITNPDAPNPPTEPAGATATEWGEAADGVRLRLRPNKTVWAERDQPMFRLDTRSDKERVLPYYGPPLDDFDVRLDGIWYRRNALGKLDLRSVGPSPGTERMNLHTRLNPRDWASEDSDTTMTAWSSGAHTVRIGFVVSPAAGQNDKPLRAVSNPVEIEIAAPPDNPLGLSDDVLKKMFYVGQRFGYARAANISFESQSKAFRDNPPENPTADVDCANPKNIPKDPFSSGTLRFFLAPGVTMVYSAGPDGDWDDGKKIDPKDPTLDGDLSARLFPDGKTQCVGDPIIVRYLEGKNLARYLRSKQEPVKNPEGPPFPERGYKDGSAQHLVWGPVNDGLRAAVELVPTKSEYLLGEPIKVRFHVENVSTTTIQIRSGNRQESHPAVRDGQGNTVSVTNAPSNTGLIQATPKEMKPGQTVVYDNDGLCFGELASSPQDFSLGTTVHGGPGVYTLTFPNIGFFAYRPEEWEGALEMAPVKVTIAGPAQTSRSVEVFLGGDKGDSSRPRVRVGGNEAGQAGTNTEPASQASRKP
jgi:beta-lactamase regulating signal transducer with metallopeptidase domain